MAAKEMQNPGVDAQAEEQAHHLCCRFAWLALVQGAQGKTRQTFGGLHPLADEGHTTAHTLCVAIATRFTLFSLCVQTFKGGLDMA